MFVKSIHLIVLFIACFALIQAAPLTRSPRSISRRCSPRSRGNSTTTLTGSPSASSPSIAKPTSTLASSSSSNKDGDKTSNGKAQGVESLQALFPLGRGSTSWTTSDKANGALSLSDATLRPTKDMKQLSHDITTAPDGSKGMEAKYPKGSMNPGNDPEGGFSFYALGPKSMDLTTAKEITLGYSVYFKKGFNWVRGGKLPGVFGGDNDQVAASCSGGRRDDACFSARLMWRGDGEGEFYTYFPPSEADGANKKICSVKPESDCNDTYGASVGRGSFHFKDGAWTTVTERIRLNDIGKKNGEIELFANGKSVINVSGLVLRTNEKGRFRGIQMQTFFGGSHDGFQAKEDSTTWFKDFSMAITEEI